MVSNGEHQHGTRHEADAPQSGAEIPADPDHNAVRMVTQAADQSMRTQSTANDRGEHRPHRT
jgi:hypothetical protein